MAKSGLERHVVNIGLDGAEALAKKLEALPDALTRSIVIEALLAGGEPMRQTMAQRAPYEPGAPDLKANMVMHETGRMGKVTGGKSRRARAGEYLIAVGPAAPFFYGLFQEYGTVRHGAQPFMRPAFDQHDVSSLKIIMDQLWEAVRKQATHGVPQA